MVANKLTEELPFPSDAVAGRDEGIVREVAIIAKAEADIDAKLGVEDGDVEAWLEALDNDPNTPLPSGQNGRAVR